MPVTPQLIDEFKKLIRDYSAQSKYKVLPGLRADSNLTKTLTRLDGLLTAITEQGNELNDQIIIYSLTTYVMDKTTSDPVFFACVQQFLKNYQTITNSVCSILDPMHLERRSITEANELISTVLLRTIHDQTVRHDSEKLVFERQLEAVQRENAQLKLTVEALKQQEIALKQLKTKFQQFQQINDQLHQAGIAFLGFDQILKDPSLTNDATPTVPVETTLAPPPPPPPPLPNTISTSLPRSTNEPTKQAASTAPIKETVRFRPDVEPLSERNNLMSQLKHRLEILAAKNTALKTEQTEPSTTLNSTASSKPVPQHLARESIKPISVQEHAEIQASQANSTSFFQSSSTLSAAQLAVSDVSTDALKPRTQPNSLERYQATQKTNLGKNLFDAIGKRRPAINGHDSDTESDDSENWETISLT